MEEPHEASFAELQKHVSKVVKKVLKEELDEVKDLLLCVLRQQSSLSDEIKKTRSTALKPELCKRLVPTTMPRIFTDESRSNASPVTLDQLQEKQADRLRSVSISDDIGRMSPLADPSPLRSVIAQARLKPMKPKTSKEGSASSSLMVIPALSNHSIRAPAVGIIGDAESPAHSLDNAVSIIGNSSLRAPAHPLGKAVRVLGDVESVSDGNLKPPCSPFSAPCAPMACTAFMDHQLRSPSPGGQLEPLWTVHVVDRTLAQVLFKLFGILTFQGRAGYLLPAIVNLILLWAATWTLVRDDDHTHRRLKLWSAFNGALMCLGMVMALCCLRCTQIQKLVAPECCPLRLYSQWISTIPSNLLAATVFLVMQFSLTSFATLTADLFSSAEMLDRGQACSGEESWLLQPLLMIISKGLLLTYVLLRAARISHKCDRTKHFINSLLHPPSEDSSYLDTGNGALGGHAALREFEV
ncbi:unnamed protein product [Polarella glacialis]|uniref:Transmembrane protein n=1 Tax=Polarella glacialis TaxID=89957 RepID=A0A813GPN2_POLGL|nr:unnamed protein product [Polarella glacialis]